jgi:hypothetical protein
MDRFDQLALRMERCRDDLGLIIAESAAFVEPDEYSLMRRLFKDLNALLLEGSFARFTIAPVVADAGPDTSEADRPVEIRERWEVPRWSEELRT